MAQTAQEVFNLHRMQIFEPVLRGVHGTYLFDIDKVGSWFLAVDDGAIHVEETKRDADCTISCDEPDFVDIVEGRRQLMTSHMQGRVRIHGDIALAQKFHGLVSDGKKRKVDSLSSNIGHLLWSGIVDDDKAEACARHLVGPRLFSGWGFAPW